MKHFFNKRIAAIVLIFAVFFASFAPVANASILNPAIYTVSGTVYADTDGDGVMELHNLDLPLANMTVTLHKTLADAQTGTNAVASAKTNAVGVYNFTKLTKGNYFIKYGTETTTKPIVQQNSALDATGKQIPGIATVTINTLNVVTWADLATKKATNLTLTPFEDLNGNGVKDSNESIITGKTLIFINLEKTADLISSGRLSELDLNSKILGALGGSLDIEDAILFRTSSKNEAIQMPDVDPGMYVMIRSPFNLTVGDLLGNIDKVTAIIDIISGGDIQGILDNPTLLDTGDISTTPNNDYIKALATFLPKAINSVEKVDVEKYLGTETATSVNTTLSEVQSIATLLNHIPSMRFAKVDIWGNSYDLTGLKFTKTTDFQFGIRKLPVITGDLFVDKNKNGKKDLLEFGKATKVTAYDANGNVLQSITTSSLTTKFTLDKIPFDKTVYIGIDGTNGYSPVYTGAVPSALQGLRLVGAYTFDSKSSIQEIKQNIPLLP
ncbi:hypothetical protein HB852_04790 [Listeria grandensis]|uniref:carboxypeptidase-like regulatory domain-containing protein n=1 Tax=Listeria grandensis TaxID=1494963 RepID=UPI001624316B|nr:carboxypeptidase-like regulatory domain-containing protein [Listeria grandensis]MBC1473922.1 hypothetical protein [Listeria grandensis]